MDCAIHDCAVADLRGEEVSDLLLLSYVVANGAVSSEQAYNAISEASMLSFNCSHMNNNSIICQIQIQISALPKLQHL